MGHGGVGAGVRSTCHGRHRLGFAHGVGRSLPKGVARVHGEGAPRKGREIDEVWHHSTCDQL